MDNIVTELLDLPNINVTEYKIINDTVYIYIESTETKVPCRECGKETTPNGFAREIKLRHLPMMGKPCYLIIKPKRGTCSFCNGSPTTNQRLDWYEYKSRYTKAYENYILLSLVNSTVSDVAIKDDIGADAVDGILKRRIASKLNWNDYSKIGLLGKIGRAHV